MIQATSREEKELLVEAPATPPTSEPLPASITKQVESHLHRSMAVCSFPLLSRATIRPNLQSLLNKQFGMACDAMSRCED